MTRPSQRITQYRIETLIFLCLILFGSGYPEALGQGTSTSQLPANTQIERQLDPAFARWEARDKYFLVVTATQTGGQDTDLPYAKVDGDRVATVLEEKGYKKIDTLTDKNATRERFVESLKQIRTLNEDSLVVIYYSGHGVPDPQGKDLWLQLYGQKYFGDFQGLSVSNVINAARANRYKGELVVIIDACYSAQGAWAKSLSLDEIQNTLIFASSSLTQKSFAIDISPGKIMSAFTYYLLEGLTKDWDAVDENHDGIIQYEDLQKYIDVKLAESFAKLDQNGKEMTPEISGQQAKMWAAFDPQKAQNLKTLLRQALSLKNSLKTQLPKLLQQNPQQSIMLPSVAPRARELAQSVPAKADPYIKALQAIAENRNDDALRLLEEAEKNRAADLLDIYQARATALIYSGRVVEGGEWYEKALALNRADNPDLLEEAGLAFFMLSDFAKSQKLLGQALKLREQASSFNADMALDLMILGVLDLFRFDIEGCEAYFRRILNLSPHLDAVAPGYGLIPLYLLANTYIIRDKEDEAEGYVRQILSAPANVLPSDNPFRIRAISLLAVIHHIKGNKKSFEETVDNLLTLWETAIASENMEGIKTYIDSLSQFDLIGRILEAEPKLSSRLEALYEKSYRRINEHLALDDLDLALTLRNLASAHLALGKRTEAEEIFKKALEVSDRMYRGHSFISALLHHDLGMLYFGMKRYQEAERAFKEGLEVAEKMVGQQSIFLLAILKSLGEFYQDRGNENEAERIYKRAIEMTQHGAPSIAALSPVLLEDLADLYVKQKKPGEAEKLYQQALEIIDRLHALSNERELTILFKLASLNLSLRAYPEAEKAAARLKTRQENINTQTSDFAKDLVLLAEACFFQKRIPEAVKYNNQALTIAQTLPPAQKDDFVEALMIIADSYSKQKMFNDAERLYAKVIALYHDPRDNIRPTVADRLYNLADYYVSRSKYNEAESLLKQALEIDESALGKDSPQVATDLDGLAYLYRVMLKDEEAISMYSRAISIWEKASNQEALLYDLNKSSGLYLETRRYAEAKPLIMRVMKIWEDASKNRSPDYATCLINLAIVYCVGEQDYADAEKLLQRAVTINEQFLQGNPLPLVEDLVLLSDVYRFQNRFRETEKLIRRASQIIEKAFGKDHLIITENYFRWGLLYQAEGKMRAATSSFEQAVQKSLQRPRSEQASIALWLEGYVLNLRYMKRDDEARKLESYGQRLRAKASDEQ